MKKKRHIRVYDLKMNLVAVLENAYKIGYELEVNNLGRCWFTLPLNDSKKEEVTSKRFIELWDHDKYIGKFIVNPKRTVKNESDNSITFSCEHVLATLHSDILFKDHQYTNYTTRTVLSTLLDRQEVKHWKLGEVEFTRYFHYFFENEDSLLNAIFSVPKSFDESYVFTWDDTSYPFTLNLVRPTNKKVDVVRSGKNLKGIEKEEDPTNLITRIYPLGYGEGVNQLTIESVNNGVPYLEAPPDLIEKYGVHKRIWVDRRFKDAEALKQSGQAFLNKYQEPIVTVAIDMVDYRHLDPYKVLDYNTSDVIGVYDEDTETETDLRIMKIRKNDIYGNPFDIQMEIGNVRQNIGMTITDLQKKQLVNDTYSQGSTNIDSKTFNDNVDSSYPAIIEFPFPEDMINLNESKLWIKTSKFRAYSKAIEAGGAFVKSSTTESGGSHIQSSTTSAGGGTVTSTESGGGWVGMTGLQQEITEGIATTVHPNTHSTYGGGVEDHYHKVYPHQHEVGLPSHTHQFTLSSHSHNFSVNIPPHSHAFSLEIPSHTHPIKYGIYEYDKLPTKLTVKVDGNVVPFDGLDGEIDIIPYLEKDEGGRVKRGYHKIEVIPDDLARINLILSNRFFIQSLEGGIY